ncbi:MAG: UDP-N-acetylmuramoyl-L-alanine--D-glutamate ligase [Actinomycetota bacterium]
MPPSLVPFEVADLRRVLVVGLGVTGLAIVESLRRRGVELLVADDRADAAIPAGVERIDVSGLADATSTVDAVVPAPGVPRHHPVYATAEAAGVPVVSELDLAAAWSQRPSVAVTGTNGKTTVTEVIGRMCGAAGLDAEIVGNVDEPWVAAIDRRGADEPDLWIVEASSFRLDAIQHYRADVAVWLNFAPDHLDWHPTLDDYRAAKARLLGLQRDTAVALGDAADPVVRAELDAAPARRELVGEPDGDWRIVGDVLHTPTGPIDLRGVPPRHGPHDLVDLAAAAGAAHHLGVADEAVVEVIDAFEGLRHRLEHVGRRDGVDYFDDSKATAPHATIAALRGFDDAVLIAGGRNKGLDLSELSVVAEHLRAVVAIGDAAPEIVAAFRGRVEVTTAVSMHEAVMAATAAARPDGAVVLSPACASFDWYRNYGERGDDFARIVSEELDR